MIFDIIRRVAESVKDVSYTENNLGIVTVKKTSILSFGHGPRAYSNLDQENESMQRYGWGVEFMRAWLNPAPSKNAILANGLLQREYSLTVEIQDLLDLDASSEQIENCLRKADAAAIQFQLHLAKDPDFIKYTSGIHQLPVYHYNDVNLGGYVLTFNCLIKEVFTYCL